MKKTLFRLKGNGMLNTKEETRTVEIINICINVKDS